MSDETQKPIDGNQIIPGSEVENLEETPITDAQGGLYPKHNKLGYVTSGDDEAKPLAAVGVSASTPLVPEGSTAEAERSKQLQSVNDTLPRVPGVSDSAESSPPTLPIIEETIQEDLGQTPPRSVPPDLSLVTSNPNVRTENIVNELTNRGNLPITQKPEE